MISPLIFPGLGLVEAISLSSDWLTGFRVPLFGNNINC